MITIDKVEEGLPVSVVVPLSSHRRKFFEQFVLPSIEAMQPREIIINDNIATAPQKRNAGFKKSTQPFVLFCDDDIILPADYLENLLKALKDNPERGYAYTGYKGIVNTEAKLNSVGTNFEIATRQFSAQALRHSNYISTMALIRREVFTGFDESLKRFQDWDLWLTLLSKGIEGVAVPGSEFLAFFNDNGQTNISNDISAAYAVIAAKHRLTT